MPVDWLLKKAIRQKTSNQYDMHRAIRSAQNSATKTHNRTLICCMHSAIGLFKLQMVTKNLDPGTIHAVIRFAKSESRWHFHSMFKLCFTCEMKTLDKINYLNSGPHRQRLCLLIWVKLEDVDLRIREALMCLEKLRSRLQKLEIPKASVLSSVSGYEVWTFWNGTSSETKLNKLEIPGRYY